MNNKCDLSLLSLPNEIIDYIIQITIVFRYISRYCSSGGKNINKIYEVDQFFQRYIQSSMAKHMRKLCLVHPHFKKIIKKKCEYNGIYWNFKNFSLDLAIK